MNQKVMIPMENKRENNVYIKHQKLKVWALLYSLKTTENSVDNSELFLVLAFDLNSAMETANKLVEKGQADSKNYILKKWLGVEYDELFPDLYKVMFSRFTLFPGTITQVKISQQPPLEKLEKEMQVQAEAEATPSEKFFYGFQYVLDKSEASEEERRIVNNLLDRFKKQNGIPKQSNQVL